MHPNKPQYSVVEKAMDFVATMMVFGGVAGLNAPKIVPMLADPGIAWSLTVIGIMMGGWVRWKTLSVINRSP